jgi:oxygen-independent coproporphyrinogen III oxidase
MNWNESERSLFNIPAPRYTSYPPANLFGNTCSYSQYMSYLQDVGKSGSLSFYVHIPFCPQRCHFCGCNTEIGIGAKGIAAYFKALSHEMQTILPLLDSSSTIMQIHFGGGTPNAVPLHFLASIIEQLKDRFELDPSAEVAIECDPALLTSAKLIQLREIGFNRISFGVQDLKLDVIEAVNRRIPAIAIAQWVKEARELGFKGINLDFIYGLPGQTCESFAQTMESAAQIRPDRFSIFSYAHVPWFKPHQESVRHLHFPEPAEKLEMMLNTRQYLSAQGYEVIGMDHYALPTDDLSLAKHSGLLRRNFQGYNTARTTGEVVALGASGISQLKIGFFQNTKEVSAYTQMWELMAPTLEKSHLLTIQECFIGRCIEELMCNGEVHISSIIAEFPERVKSIRHYFAERQAKLLSMESYGLIELTEDALKLTQRGEVLVRLVAMQLDPLMDQQGANHYSRVL